TRGTAADERRRGLLVADALVRSFVPHLLDRRGRPTEAAALRAVPQLGDEAAVQLALRGLEAFAPDVHAARWVLQRALDGNPPARWVAGAVPVLARVGDTGAFALASATIAAMLAAGAAMLAAGAALPAARPIDGAPVPVTDAAVG